MSDHRVEKLNSLIQRILANYIVKDFCVSRDIIISVTRVETSGNGFESKVFISAFPTQERAKIVKSLNYNIAEFQHKLNKDLRMRPVPKITFVEDKKPEQAQEVEQLLAQIEKNKKI
jgi:ribosome-binding factor A